MLFVVLLLRELPIVLIQKDLENEWKKQMELLQKEREALWKEVLETLELVYKNVNRKIPEYNFIVPSMNLQLPQFSVQRELQLVKEYFARGEFDVELYKEGTLTEVTTILVSFVRDPNEHKE
jgi:hypothetical protein